jgi:hypothetical protein
LKEKFPHFSAMPVSFFLWNGTDNIGDGPKRLPVAEKI